MLMPQSIFVRLVSLCEDLERLTRYVQPLEIRLALEHLTNRLDALVDDTIGVDAPALEDVNDAP